MHFEDRDNSVGINRKFSRRRCAGYMTKDNIMEKRFPFLHSHLAREPYVYDILNEIMNVQAAYLKSGIGTLATLEDLKNSRNIKIPFTITRNKTIADLMETLLKTYPIEIRPIITFSFTIDPETKRLSAHERQEFTVLLSNEEFNRIQSERNRESSENLLALIARDKGEKIFRGFAVALGLYSVEFFIGKEDRELLAFVGGKAFRFRIDRE